MIKALIPLIFIFMLACGVLAPEEFPETQNTLGWDAYDQGDYTKAIEHFTEAIELESYSTYHINRAQAYMALEDIDNAVKDYRKAVDLSGNEERLSNEMFSLYSQYGVALLVSQRYEDAIVYMDRAFEIYGYSYSSEQKASGTQANNKSIENTSILLPTDPITDEELAWNHWHRGMAHFNLKNLTEAEQDFVLACKLNSDYC